MHSLVTVLIPDGHDVGSIEVVAVHEVTIGQLLCVHCVLDGQLVGKTEVVLINKVDVTVGQVRAVH